LVGAEEEGCDFNFFPKIFFSTSPKPHSIRCSVSLMTLPTSGQLSAIGR
jgi:hypothetical protein